MQCRKFARDINYIAHIINCKEPYLVHIKIQFERLKRRYELSMDKKTLI